MKKKFNCLFCGEEREKDTNQSKCMYCSNKCQKSYERNARISE